MSKAAILFYERCGRWLPAVLSLLLAVAIGWSLSSLIWTLVPPPKGAGWQPQAVVVGDEATARPERVNVQQIIAAHLFGEYRAEAAPVVQTVIDAPDTRLNLTLTGILAATEDKGSRALISQGSSDEKPYAVGSVITRGVELQSIYPDRVILSRNGSLETLRLDKDKPSSFTPAAYTRPEAPSSGNERTISGTEAYQLAEIREQLLADPAKASDYLRVQPARIGGEMRGYRIYPGRNRQLFSTAGLRPGDLVTGVNGVELDDPARALQLLGDLSSASELSVTIERGGNQQTINVNLN